MDFIDFFENMGLGLAIVVVVVVFIFLITFLRVLIPILLMGLGGLFGFLLIIVFIGAVIYLIGKFSKDFIKNR